MCKCDPSIRTFFCGRGDCVPPRPKHEKTLLLEIFKTCDEIRDGRTNSDILNHTMSEVGELATEVIIANGRSYKQEGADGIIGESIDVIICALDMIRQVDPSLTEEQLIVIASRKLDKWKNPPPIRTYTHHG